MIETILAFTVPAAYGLFRIIVILTFVIQLIRFNNIMMAVSYSKEEIFARTFQAMTAAILIAGSMITLAILYSS